MRSMSSSHSVGRLSPSGKTPNPTSHPEGSQSRVCEAAIVVREKSGSGPTIVFNHLARITRKLHL